jgi:hypothetical protein
MLLPYEASQEGGTVEISTRKGRFVMIGKLAGWRGPMLLLIEMLLPGGTLVVLAILPARRFHSGALGRLLMCVPLPGKRWRIPGRDGLVLTAPRSLA